MTRPIAHACTLTHLCTLMHIHALSDTHKHFHTFEYFHTHVHFYIYVHLHNTHTPVYTHTIMTPHVNFSQYNEDRTCYTFPLKYEEWYNICLSRVISGISWLAALSFLASTASFVGASLV